MKHGKIIRFILGFSLLVSIHANAEVDALKLFDFGNSYYQDNLMDSALVYYDSIENSGFKSAALFYNKGNAYYKLEKYTDAILYYEKAKILDPHNKEIQFNLDLANLNIVDKIQPIPEFFLTKLFHKITNIFNTNLWAKITILLIWLSIIVLVASYWFPKSNMRFMIRTFSFFLLFLFGLGFTVTKAKSNFENKEKFAIVYEPTVYCKSSPDANSTELFIIHEGLKIEIMEKVEGYSKIKLPDGKIAWILDNAYKVI